jgi:hypothetical protein
MRGNSHVRFLEGLGGRKAPWPTRRRLIKLGLLAMEEIGKILTKYDEEYIRQNFTDVVSINAFALSFYKDAAEIYDTLTRVKNVERNTNGFDLNDAPILGLLVRIWKLFKEILKYSEQDNAEIISILERPLIEAAVMATYLMRSNDSVIEDYRKCSYKDRLRILRSLESGSPFFETKAGKRLLNSVQGKMLNEQLTTEDFGEQYLFTALLPPPCEPLCRPGMSARA